MDGCPGGLCELLQHSEPGLVTEVAWVTAYATASQQVRRLLAAGILQPLLGLLSKIAQEVGTLHILRQTHTTIRA